MQSNISLHNYNTLSIPAKTSWFMQVDNHSGLIEALDFIRQKKCPLLILGEGSNIVFADDYDGLVVLNRLFGKQMLEENQDSVLIKVSAGENWHKLVEWTLSNDWYGLQNLALIPGTVGAAPIQNIGAYGVELQDVFVSLDAVDIASGKTMVFDRQQCQFAYRESVFKQQWRDKLCVTSITLRLQKKPNQQTSYPALKQYFEDQGIDEPSPHQVFDAVCAVRRSKLPDPEQLPNAGSFFKNPVVCEHESRRLRVLFPDIVAFQVEDGFKLAAGWLIEQVGWKGKQIDQVATHQQQALVIVNPHACSGQQVLSYAHQLQKIIKQKFDVGLEIEPRIYGKPKNVI